MQGFNMGRYLPPDAHGTHTSGNRLHSKPHALGSRASRLASHGILIVRFEMPFAVWCAHCPQPTLIGQGVRFNAEKRRVGEYYSTPVWGFTLRHAACGGVVEMRTDPKNAEFVVVSGARRRDYGGEGKGDDSLVASLSSVAPIVTERERAEQRAGAFGKLERTIADREKLVGATQRIEELQEAAERQWEDPYALNQRLRKAFRVGRHAREEEAVRTEALTERMGLGIELLPEAEEDAKRARLVDFGEVDVEKDVSVGRALAKPLFAPSSSSHNSPPKREEQLTTNASNKPKPTRTTATVPAKKKLKSELAAARTRENLVSEIVSNTRATRDPFLDFGTKGNGTPKGRPARLPGIKRKRPVEEVGREGEENEKDVPEESQGSSLKLRGNGDVPKEKGASEQVASSTSLVDYGSDSD
ncbi:CWC16 protein [Dichotomopilus funicola]|uniref:CWC16 protein n=1 Tax=Dichotomopilus funicola TaxID=1934379 RepID=A0AAN6VA79_9PEZI|nr:CWC16 protein [Dichotomopilus funicola]